MSKNVFNPAEYSIPYLYDHWKIGCGDMDIDEADLLSMLANNSEKYHVQYQLIRGPGNNTVIFNKTEIL